MNYIKYVFIGLLFMLFTTACSKCVPADISYIIKNCGNDKNCIKKLVGFESIKEYDNQIKKLQKAMTIDGIVEPVYTQDCMPKTLFEKGVTIGCFEFANLGSDDNCTNEQIKLIKEYYEVGYKTDKYSGTPDYCAY